MGSRDDRFQFCGGHLKQRCVPNQRHAAGGASKSTEAPAATLAWAVPASFSAIAAAANTKPADAASADAAPADAAPTEPPPRRRRPADAAPTDSAPADAAPADSAPAKSAPPSPQPPPSPPPPSPPPPSPPPPKKRFAFGSKPNLLYLMTDDWEYASFPIHASDGSSEMKGAGQGPGIVNNDPMYDDLYPATRKWFVEDGLYLHRHYATPVCTPSRKQAMSGRLITTQGNGEWNPLRPRFTTIAEKAQASGIQHALPRQVAHRRCQ